MAQTNLTTPPVLTLTSPGNDGKQVDIFQTDTSTDFIPKNTSDISISPSEHLVPAVNKSENAVQSPRSSISNPLSPQENRVTAIVADDEENNEKSPSVDELRRRHEDEQIDRFLRVFARVHEVNIPQELTVKKGSVIHTPGSPTMQSMDDADDDSGEEWRLDNDQDISSNSIIPTVISQTVSSPMQAVNSAATVVADATTQAVQTIKEQSNNTYTLLHRGHWYGQSPAEYIAMELLVPYLPNPHRRTYEFTSSGIQQTASRLYLAIQPLYAPFMVRLWSLMSWEDSRQSFVYCMLFWILWFYDLLLPALMARLCYALVRRKVLPYPTKKELLEHKDAAYRADIMGADIRAYLDAKGTGTVGLKDAWKVFRLLTKKKKQPAKENVNIEDEATEADEETAQEEEINKRAMLTILEEIADLHERFANLCHWRRPKASMRYAGILFIMIFVTMYAPPKYILKGMYAVAGILFWFIPTIVMAIPPEHRCRIPQPLSDVPTDAEYAMDILSQRVESGEEVLPSKMRKKVKKPASIHNEAASPTRSTFSLAPVISFQSRDRSGKLEKDKSVVSFASVGDVDEACTDEDGAVESSRIKRFQQKVKGVILPDQSKRQESLDDEGNPLPEETFPAKYGALMGMISLTPTSLIFYPMLSSNAKVVIPLQDVCNVKKAGRMGGLKVKYVTREDGSLSAAASPRMSIDDKASIGGTTLGRVVSNASTVSHASVNERGVIATANGELLKEEKFGWVSNRDVLFAKLVGWGGRRWVKK